MAGVPTAAPHRWQGPPLVVVVVLGKGEVVVVASRGVRGAIALRVRVGLGVGK